MPGPKAPFTITYRKPGTSPPIFVAGTFTDPQWQLREMDQSKEADGEYTFHITAMLEPGEDHQFKIRIGKGDWWVLADGYPTVTDDSGNQNNLLSVPESFAQGNPLTTELNGTNIDPGHEAKSLPPQPRVQISQSEDTKPVEEELKTPLFTHECFGAYEFTDNGSDQDSWDHESPRRQSRPRSKDYDVADLDINDPTIEKFPSDRTSILDALRTIQTHLSEDQTHLDDIPPSPRVVSTRRASLESIEETSLSPSLSPTTTRRREGRLSHSSGRTKSAVSLGSIAEEPKPGSQGSSKSQAKPIVSPQTRPSRKGLKPPSPEEDEAIVMGTSEVNPNEKSDKISLSQIRSNKPVHDGQRREKNEATDSIVAQSWGEPKEGVLGLTNPMASWLASWTSALFGKRLNIFMATGMAALAIGIIGWKGIGKKIQESLA